MRTSCDGESNSIANQKRILETLLPGSRAIPPIRHYDEDDGYSGANFVEVR